MQGSVGKPSCLEPLLAVWEHAARLELQKSPCSHWWKWGWGGPTMKSSCFISFFPLGWVPRAWKVLPRAPHCPR
jgi:hypothetical protein